MQRKHLSLAIAAGLTIAVAATASAVPVGFTGDRSADLARAINPNQPKSVILLIGDGMDDSMITAARNYSVGADGRLEMDTLPFTGAMTTHGLKTGIGPDYPIAYVSDSAPTASGWSTGKKTVDGRVSQGPSEAETVPGTDFKTVLETFKESGKRTGNVSTAEITDATPAAAASHINARACQGPRPADMSKCLTARKSVGGKGSIAEQLVDNKIDVILGGGLNRYTQATDAGPTVLDYATSTLGYTSVTDKAGLAGITSLNQGPVLGLFSGGHMTRKYEKLLAMPGGAGGNDARCTAANRGTQPTLAEMTSKAISLLHNDKGFFLQVEGASIDKAEHDRDICGAIGELEDLDEAVKVALDYQKANPETLVIVTGDHAHSTQIVPNTVFQASQTVTLKSADGDPLTIAYSTDYSTATQNNPLSPNTVVGSSTHTGAQIRVAAIGPQAANMTGVIDQTDLYATMMGRVPSTMPTPPPATVTVTPSPQPQPTPPPSTTDPAPKAAPVAKIAVARKIKRTGARMAVSVVGADQVVVRIKQGTRKRTVKLSSSGGVVTLTKLRKGKVTVRVIATGEGGRTVVRRTLKVA